MSLRSADPIWRSAFVHDDKTYDVSVGEAGAESELSKPAFEKDERNRIRVAEFRLSDRKQAERFAKTMAEKENVERVEIEVVYPEIPLKMAPTFEIGSAIKRMALKMCIALSSMLPEFELEDVNEARKELFAEPSLIPINAREAYFTYEPIDTRRPALSHLIYIERSQARVYGLVQFFGAVQLFCRLGIPKGAVPDSGAVYLGGGFHTRATSVPVSVGDSTALIALLDPVTGDEEIHASSPLNLIEPPICLDSQGWEGWKSKLRGEALKRGANPPGLKIDFLK